MVAEATPITCVGEGPLDHAILTRLIRSKGGEIGRMHGGEGKPPILRNLDGYNVAARHSLWLVMVDLNGDYRCAPEARTDWMVNPADTMCFVVAVRQVEAWLLADAERISRFLSVSRSRIPRQPEQLQRPKRDIVQLARRSRSRRIREDLVPRQRSGREVGSAYTSRLIDFVEDLEQGWRPYVAAESAPSLARCLTRLNGMV